MRGRRTFKEELCVHPGCNTGERGAGFNRCRDRRLSQKHEQTMASADGATAEEAIALSARPFLSKVMDAERPH